MDTTLTLSSFPWKTLLDWYKLHGRHSLPWRQYDLTENIRLYRVWLAEILLQQTQADRVVWYFDRIIYTYPSIESLANASYEEFFPYYQWLGYYSRARNILKTAKIISEEYTGLFPRETEKLIQLPWVWPYTAEAIRSFGYNIPTLAWDTNLEKVFARYTTGNKYNRLSESEKSYLRESFSEFMKTHEYHAHHGIARDMNNALMDFASMIDLKNPSQIDWENYPIRSGVWYETRGTLEPVIEKISQSFPTPDATIIVFLHENHRIYYSESQSQYTPFILPPALTRETRKYIQDIFRERYNIELSVRPPHKKWLSQEGKPYIAVNAQIQAGRAEFTKYMKKELDSYILP
jgi:A/G-specific adenine glycosylase